MENKEKNLENKEKNMENKEKKKSKETQGTAFDLVSSPQETNYFFGRKMSEKNKGTAFDMDLSPQERDKQTDKEEERHSLPKLTFPGQASVDKKSNIPSCLQKMLF